MRNAIFLTLPFAILQAKRDWKMKREPVHLNRNEKYFNVINIWVSNLLASIRRINKIKWRQIELINCKDNSTPELTRSFFQAFFHDAVSLLLTRRNTRSRKLRASLRSFNLATHRVNLPRSIRIHTRFVRLCLALQTRKSRVKGWFRVACVSQGKQWANPGPGRAPQTRANWRSYVHVCQPISRSDRQSIDSQRRTDGSVILLNWGFGREMFTKSSRRKRLSLGKPPSRIVRRSNGHGKNTVSRFRGSGEF